MRRPHVYERSVPRARRDVEQESQGDYVPATRALEWVLDGFLGSSDQP